MARTIGKTVSEGDLAELQTALDVPAPATRQDWDDVRLKMREKARRWERGVCWVPKSTLHEVLDGGVPKRALAKLIRVSPEQIDAWVTSHATEIKLTPAKARVLRWLKVIVRARLAYQHTPLETAGWLFSRVAELGFSRPIEAVLINPRLVVASFKDKWRTVVLHDAPSEPGDWDVPDPESAEAPFFDSSENGASPYESRHGDD